ncbi:hypothetical protein Ddc_06712 [Ditylenchus destructor]|nr:hypothetical protein Ddc_06712 [Ditylenchus destructor]
MVTKKKPYPQLEISKGKVTCKKHTPTKCVTNGKPEKDYLIGQPLATYGVGPAEISISEPNPRPSYAWISWTPQSISKNLCTLSLAHFAFVVFNKRGKAARSIGRERETPHEPMGGWGLGSALTRELRAAGRDSPKTGCH